MIPNRDRDVEEWVPQTGGGNKDGQNTAGRNNLILPADEGARALRRDSVIHRDQVETHARGQVALIDFDPIPAGNASASRASDPHASPASESSR